MAEQALAGSGRFVLRCGPAAARAALLDPAVLLAAIPGAQAVQHLGDGRFQATIRFGVGWFAGHYAARLAVSDGGPPAALTLAGSAAGMLGGGRAAARVELGATPSGGTVVAWTYDGAVSGPVAHAGRRVLQAGSDLFIRRFFANLARTLRIGTGGRPW